MTPLRCGHHIWSSLTPGGPPRPLLRSRRRRKEGSGDADGVLEKAVNREGKRWPSRKRTSQSRKIDSNFARVRVVAKD